MVFYVEIHALTFCKDEFFYVVNRFYLMALRS